MRDLLNKHLILVQAFPANSILSAGIIQYLERIFKVDFIDLPGFHKDVPPLKEISIESYAKFVAKKIKEINPDEYILGGISFGAMLANNVKVDERCIAILDTAPFLGVDYLRFSKTQERAIRAILKVLTKNNLGVGIWDTLFFKNTMISILDKDPRDINIILEHVDPRTFFETGQILLNYREKPKLQKKPHILLMNPEDTVVDFDKVLDFYREHIDPDNLRVIVSNLAHYPDNPDFNYFLKNITTEQIHSLLSFFEYLKDKKNFKIFDSK